MEEGEKLSKRILDLESTIKRLKAALKEEQVGERRRGGGGGEVEGGGEEEGRRRTRRRRGEGGGEEEGRRRRRRGGGGGGEEEGRRRGRGGAGGVAHCEPSCPCVDPCRQHKAPACLLLSSHFRPLSSTSTLPFTLSPIP
jgi:hypothetical protein